MGRQCGNCYKSHFKGLRVLRVSFWKIHESVITAMFLTLGPATVTKFTASNCKYHPVTVCLNVTAKLIPYRSPVVGLYEGRRMVLGDNTHQGSLWYNVTATATGCVPCIRSPTRTSVDPHVAMLKRYGTSRYGVKRWWNHNPFPYMKGSLVADIALCLLGMYNSPASNWPQSIDDSCSVVIVGLT